MYTYGHHDFFQEPGIMLCTQEVEKNSITIESEISHEFVTTRRSFCLSKQDTSAIILNLYLINTDRHVYIWTS